MSDSLVLYAGIMLFSTFVSSVSQVILKKAAGKTYESRIREYLNFPVIFAYSLFFVSTLLTVFAYRVVPMSMGPLLESSSYIYVTIFGVVIFKEKITKQKVFALVLILAGIAVYSLGA